MSKGDRSFAAKVRKQARKIDKRYVKVIRSGRDPETGTVRFSSRIMAVPTEADLGDFIQKELAKED